jgi:hypothetical protein
MCVVHPQQLKQLLLSQLRVSAPRLQLCEQQQLTQVGCALLQLLQLLGEQQ